MGLGNKKIWKGRKQQPKTLKIKNVDFILDKAWKSLMGTYPYPAKTGTGRPVLIPVSYIAIADAGKWS